MEYGYCRISTPKQSIERQVRNISSRFPAAEIIQEVYTGTKFQGRKKMEGLLEKIRPGDTVIFDSVSRMSRDAASGFALYKKLYKDGVNLIFLKEPHINTSTYRDSLNKTVNIDISTGDAPTDTFLNAITDALNNYMLSLAEKQIEMAFASAEEEVRILRERTKEGLVTAKLNGKRIGRKTGDKLHVKKAGGIKDAIENKSKDFLGDKTDRALIQELGISTATYYKYKKELKLLHGVLR